MTMKKIIVWCFIGTAVFSMSSCLVAKKKFDEQVALADKLKAERDNCNDKLAEANATIDNLNQQIAKLDAEIAKLKELAEKEKTLMAKAEELNKLSRELNERDAKVRELMDLIAKKDAAVQALKKKMLDALKGFSDAGELTVYEKDGKIYVALSDKLLFATGSYNVEPRGKEALKQIADVLNKQNDIMMMVEGHTDNKPYGTTTGPINSNWDLSVMRASSVTKILVNDNKVDAKRITPAGRGEFFPVESNETVDGRSKNRRIDIVLTPDMKGIFDILNATN
jgi:chemotaxis protein MotB